MMQEGKRGKDKEVEKRRKEKRREEKSYLSCKNRFRIFEHGPSTRTSHHF